MKSPIRHPVAMALPLTALLAGCGGGAAGSAAANDAAGNAPAPLAATANQADAATPGGPTANWHLPMRSAQLGAAERDAIIAAAGYQKRNGRWDASEGPGDAPEDRCPVTIEDQALDGPAIRDLNGDGRPEVIVTASGLACFGMAGQGFAIVTPEGTGWRAVINTGGIPAFRHRAGAAWPDIVIGGPGTCFGKMRWNGREYVAAGHDDGEGHPCTIPGMEDEPAPAPAAAPEGASRPVAPLGLAAGYYVEEGSPCSAPSGGIYYYDGRRYAMIYPSTPETSETSPVGHPHRSGHGWDMDDGSRVEVLSPTRMRFTYEETGPPMRLCPTSRLPANIRVR